jgi:hypothetical protein
MTVGPGPWSLASSTDSSSGSCLLMNASIPARRLARDSSDAWINRQARLLFFNAVLESIDLPQQFPGLISEVQIVQSW